MLSDSLWLFQECFDIIGKKMDELDACSLNGQRTIPFWSKYSSLYKSFLDKAQNPSIIELNVLKWPSFCDDHV